MGLPAGGLQYNLTRRCAALEPGSDAGSRPLACAMLWAPGRTSRPLACAALIVRSPGVRSPWSRRRRSLAIFPIIVGWWSYLPCAAGPLRPRPSGIHGPRGYGVLGSAHAGTCTQRPRVALYGRLLRRNGPARGRRDYSRILLRSLENRECGATLGSFRSRPVGGVGL